MIYCRFAKFALIFLSIFLLFLQISHTLHYPIWFDDSFFATVAKSLVNGEGYSAVFFDKSYPFHFGISSGPLVILPAAALMFFFGNQYWVPDLANILVIWSLLITIFILSDSFIGREKKWSFAFLALSLALLFTTNSYGNGNTDRLVLWHLLMGEIPAALCLIIATFLLFSPQFSQKKNILGALFLGLAISCKSIVAMPAAVILIFYLAQILFQQNSQKLAKIRLLFLVGFCVIAPFLLFEIVKLIALGLAAYKDSWQQVINFYDQNAIVDFSNHKNGVNFFGNPQGRSTFLQKYLNVSEPLFLPMTAYICYSAFKNRNQNEVHTLYAGFALILGSALNFYWWILFSSGCDRHLAIGIISYFAGLTLLLKAINYSKQWRWQSALVALFVALLFASRSQEIEYLSYQHLSANDQGIAEQILIVDELTKLEKQGVQFISCGNNTALEYLMPQSRNFKKCEEILTGKISTQTMLVNYFFDPFYEPQRVIRINENQYYGDTMIVPQKILAKCNRQYLKGETFSLNWCAID